MPKRKKGGGVSRGSRRPDPPPNAWIAKAFPAITSSQIDFFVCTSERASSYEYFSTTMREFALEDFLILRFIVVQAACIVVLMCALMAALGPAGFILLDTSDCLMAMYHDSFAIPRKWAAFLFDIHPGDALYAEIKNPSGYFIGLPLLMYSLFRIREIAVNRAKTHPRLINCASSCLNTHRFLLNILLCGVAISATLPKLIQFCTFVAPFIPRHDYPRPTHPFWRNFMDAEKFESVKSCCCLFFNFFTGTAICYHRFAVYDHWREVGSNFAFKLRLSDNYWRRLIGISYKLEFLTYMLFIFIVRINLCTIAWAAFIPEIAEFFDLLYLNYPIN